jgi:hypothetical protein
VRGLRGANNIRRSMEPTVKEEQPPSLDDPRWRNDVYAAQAGRKWVIWNLGYGRRVVGGLTRRFNAFDDAEAWILKT